uniref:CLIP domain-containing serine protease n=1 Tax=Corethrella appendiculata TaxID=1370023 RepID=U5EHU2_9DIPT
MFKLLIFGLTITKIIDLGSALNQGDACTDAKRQSGSCILARECPQVVAIVTNSFSSPADRDFIVQSKCGELNGSQMVCCAGIPSSSGGDGVANRHSLLPEPGECGVFLKNRIVGGEITHISDYPWMARLYYNLGQGKFGYRCGGSLINDRYVLTAAHCIKAIPATWKLIQVRLGDWDSESEHDCEDDDCSDPVVDVDVESVTVHNEYSPSSKAQYNDIALIRMRRAVRYTDWVKPVCLPVTATLKNKDVTGVKLFVAGWGKTEFSSGSRFKLHVGLVARSLAQCNSAYTRSGAVLKDTQLCAGGDKGKDSCSGDSGGPLMKEETSTGNPFYWIVGIVSFGPKNCGTENLPGVYTKVSKYVNWIESNVRN